MKTIIYFFFAIFLFSCSQKSPKDILIEDTENLLTSELNDPSSYEFVSFEIDTTKRQIINQRIQDLKLQLEKYQSIPKNKELIAKINDEIDATKAKDLPKNQIEFSFKYRAKNGFNATILSEKTIVSDSDYNFKEMY